MSVTFAHPKKENTFSLLYVYTYSNISIAVHIDTTNLHTLYYMHYVCNTCGTVMLLVNGM